mgnify:CR=1 FL=1
MYLKSLFKSKKFFFTISILFTILTISIILRPEIYKRKYWLKSNFPRLFIFYKNTQFKFEKLNLKFNKNIDNNNNNNLKTNKENKILDTHWHALKKEIVPADGYLSNQNRMAGGYMEFINEDLIIASNAVGKIFTYDFNKKSFKTIDSNLNSIYLQQDFKGKVIEKLKGTFGVKDLFFDKEESRLLASMSLEVGQGSACYGLGILETQLPINISEGINKFLNFEIFYKTKECNTQFFGHGAGGRIKRLGDKIIFTVGDHDHNLSGDIKIPQDRKNAIGKVIAIDEKGDFEVLSMGHRNQQGLTIFDNKIFSTEHGPKGGDELNLIISGKHYGWPFYSYAFADITSANVHRFPHTGKYEKPIYYFSPSIGISEVVFYRGEEFPFWNNKFLISSLKEKSLYLLDFDEKNNRILSQEKIKIGHRIRDLNISPKGKILMITDDAKIIRLSIDEDRPIKTDKKIDFIKNLD